MHRKHFIMFTITAHFKGNSISILSIDTCGLIFRKSAKPFILSTQGQECFIHKLRFKQIIQILEKIFSGEISKLILNVFLGLPFVFNKTLLLALTIKSVLIDLNMTIEHFWIVTRRWIKNKFYDIMNCVSLILII